MCSALRLTIIYLSLLQQPSYSFRNKLKMHNSTGDKESAVRCALDVTRGTRVRQFPFLHRQFHVRTFMFLCSVEIGRRQAPQSSTASSYLLAHGMAWQQVQRVRTQPEPSRQCHLGTISHWDRLSAQLSSGVKVNKYPFVIRGITRLVHVSML